MYKGNGEATLAATHAFERHTDTFGVKIKTYRAENGCSYNTDFKKDCL